VVAGREHRGGAAAQLALAEPLVLPGEARIGEDHAALEELALVTAHERERHHVEHLVRDDEAAKLHRERIEPGESPEVLRMALAEERVLALAQVRAHLEQEVVLRRRAEGLELLEEVGGEYAGSGSDLQDVAAHRLEHLARLQREAAREHGRDFGRGDEIAFRTELARPRGVIAEPGRVERELHVARERDPAAGVEDLARDVLADEPRVRGGFGGGRGQDRIGGERHRGALGYTSLSFFSYRGPNIACRIERSS